jgi:hypothetical protein
VTEFALVPFSSSPITGKAVRVAFDGGRLTSDAGVLLLADIERRLGIAERLARCLEDPRSPARVRHALAEMIRFRVLLIAAGYPDANDCDALRSDPAFKLALGRLPESGADLCSQPTISRLENLPSLAALKRMMAAMVELFCDSFEQVPRRIVLDIDDTEDRVHGRQQLALFHAHHDGRCFLPIHVYEATTGKPVAVVLRPGKAPDGAEVALVLRHVIRRIRARWPKVDILARGDSHYGRHEAMSWCERNRVGYVFGLAGNQVLLRRVAALAEKAALARVGVGWGRQGPALRRARLRRQDLGRRAPRDRPGRGIRSGHGQPVRRQQPRGRAALALRGRVLCSRPSGEPGQGPQGPPRLGPDLVLQGDGEPVPPRAAHGRLLAPAYVAGLGAEAVVLARGPVRHAPSHADQGGRPARVTELATRVRLALPSSYPYQRSFVLLAIRAARPP